MMVKCSNCSAEILEYTKLVCRHVLCTYCTKKSHRENKLRCPLNDCRKTTQPIPGTTRIPGRMRTLSSAFDAILNDYEAEMAKQEHSCLEQIEKLERSVKNLHATERRQMEDISNAFNMRMRQLEEHYDGLKRKTRDSVKERQSQLESILLDIRKVLTDIRDDIRHLQQQLKGRSKEKTNEDTEIKLAEAIKRKTAECETQTIRVDIPQFEMTFEKSEEFNLSDSVDIVAPPPVLHGKKTKLEEQFSLESVTETKWNRNKQHSAVLPADPRSLRPGPKCELWQCHFSGISVFDAQLQLLRDISCDLDDGDKVNGDMGCCYDAVVLGDERMAVAATKGLFLMNCEGFERSRLAEGWFTSVEHHCNRLYAAHYGSSSIHVFNTFTNNSNLATTIKLQCNDPQIITISISDGVLYVCLSSDGKLLTYSLSGTQLESLGQPGSGVEAGQLDGPRMCMTDAFGAALVADQDNYRLQVMGNERAWKVVRLEPQVRRPVGAVTWEGRLYVVSETDKKVYVYDCEKK